MDIRADDLRHPQVLALLQVHLHDMAQHSPPESVHALPSDALSAPDVHFFSAWDGDTLMGFGALKQLDAAQGELKSMRTSPAYLRQGVAEALLRHLIDHARDLGLVRLSLETGSPQAFAPARQLYERYGFKECAPFGDYTEDPYSVFMTLSLNG